MNIRERERIEADWQTWLRAVGPRTFTGTFADFHCDFWEWNWAITQKLKRGERVTEDDLVFLALWSRGFGKSSNAEWAAICEGALVGTGYVLYVCGTQESANDHVASIRERIESEEVTRYYPGLGDPEIGRHGNQYGWRQDFLRTRSGWAIRPVGLDVAVRGKRVGDMRPTLIIFDDVDEHDDSPQVVSKKLKRISRSIVPAGTDQTRIIFPQNLIHRNSVANQIYTRKSDVLAKRRVSGPFPAFAGLKIEVRQTDKGPINFIAAGSPTWPDLDLAACQKFLDDSGREAFDAEYQHDFAASEQGRVIPEYDEARHVISWSQFAAVFGSRFIPEHWEREVGHDVGFTSGHLSAWTWIATSAENSRLPGLRFRYRGLTFNGIGVDEQAAEVKRLMAPDGSVDRRFHEAPLVKCWRMSHEALSERMTYRAYDLPFIACDSKKTAGISQWRFYLQSDRTKPHPFHADRMGDDGQWALGFPSLFDIVDDDQVIAPRDDRGLAVHRRQTLDWRFRPDVLGVGGLSKNEPMKVDEDTADSTRMITATWGPMETSLTEDERIERALPKSLQRDSVVEKIGTPAFDHAAMVRDYEIGEIKKARQKEEENWSFEVCDPNTDPLKQLEDMWQRI